MERMPLGVLIPFLSKDFPTTTLEENAIDGLKELGDSIHKDSKIISVQTPEINLEDDDPFDDDFGDDLVDVSGITDREMDSAESSINNKERSVKLTQIMELGSTPYILLSFSGKIKVEIDYLREILNSAEFVEGKLYVSINKSVPEKFKSQLFQIFDVKTFEVI
jgi:hypothetical protein